MLVDFVCSSSLFPFECWELKTIVEQRVATASLSFDWLWSSFCQSYQPFLQDHALFSTNMMSKHVSYINPSLAVNALSSWKTALVELLSSNFNRLLLDCWGWLRSQNSRISNLLSLCLKNFYINLVNSHNNSVEMSESSMV